ncbi:hypothetical protein Sango_1874900 [Sesamum angolense]|uniref:Uncharacterized protein n=1 Tax=Sesamum angolense TaxID=2727404 RepID=A0AAE2BQH8_9LAMI|nr:hypothetical protein Sango_1874900 [Sesamum angolense]
MIFIIVVGAGSATPATFGLIMRGSLRWCLRHSLLGSVLGAAICFPIVSKDHIAFWIGFSNSLSLRLSISSDLLLGNCLLTCEDSDTVEEKSGIDAWVERLEGNLNK